MMRHPTGTHLQCERDHPINQVIPPAADNPQKNDKPKNSLTLSLFCQMFVTGV